MSENKHPLIDDPRLTAFVLGELEGAELAEFEKTIAESPQLQDEVAQLRLFCGQLEKEMVESTTMETCEPVGLTEDQKSQIAETISEANVELGKVGIGKSSGKQESKSPKRNRRRAGKECDGIGLDSSKSRGPGWKAWAIAASVILLAGIGVVAVNGPTWWANEMLASNDQAVAEEADFDDNFKGDQFVLVDGSGSANKFTPEMAKPGVDNFNSLVTEESYEGIDRYQRNSNRYEQRFLDTLQNGGFEYGGFEYRADLVTPSSIVGRDPDPSSNPEFIGNGMSGIEISGNSLPRKVAPPTLTPPGSTDSENRDGKNGEVTTLNTELAGEILREYMRSVDDLSSRMQFAQLTGKALEQMRELKRNKQWIEDSLENGQDERAILWFLQNEKKVLGDSNISRLITKQGKPNRHSLSVVDQARQKYLETRDILAKSKELEVQLRGERMARAHQVANLNAMTLAKAAELAEKERALSMSEKVLELQTQQLNILKKLESGDIDESDVSKALDKIEASQHKLARDLNIKHRKTWKRVKAIPNTSRLMVGDKEELNLTGMQVNVQVDGFRARVVIDYFYYNDRDQQLEGNFKLRLPNEASPYYFAFGESRFDFTPDAKDLDTRLRREFIEPAAKDEMFVSLNPTRIRDLRKGAWDNVKEAKMVPREKAAFAYQQTTKRRIDPALVEWAGAGVFNAKVFPLSPHKLHRIVVGYDVNLTQVDEHWQYQLALPESAGDCRVDVRVASTEKVEVTPKVGLDQFEGTASFRLENPKERSFALRVPVEEGLILKSAGQDVPYFATRVKLPLESESQNASTHAVFLVDTSLSAQPEKFNLWLKMLTRLLKDNRDVVKRFAVVFYNVEAYWWKEHYVDNTEQNVDSLMKYCNKLALEGATDLYSPIRLTTLTPWLGDNQKAKPDLFLLSDGAATWGETNLQLIGHQLESNKLGSLFAYQAGMTGTSIRALQFLTAKTGGAVFSVAGEDEAKVAARAHRKKPWRLTAIQSEGCQDVLTAGRVQWVYPDQSILVVGRGAPKNEIVFQLENANKSKTIKVPVARTVHTELAFRTYGQVSVAQLENLGETMNKVSTAYARHFRITGQTCSLLMLDSEEDYKRFNIKPEDDEFVVSVKPCREIVTEVYARNHESLADPKEMLLLWLKRLESAPQIDFKIPTALELALDKVKVPVVAGKLECKARFESDLDPSYLQSLKDGKLKYDQFVAEAKRRRGRFSDGDAIKALSNLIENNPGDLQLIRDIAFIAMEFNQPEQAYPLLKRVAMARPYNAVVYTALARCLVDMGNVDLAMVFYEIAVTGNFEKVDFRKIATTEYVSLLSQVNRGEHQTALKAYAKSRLRSLQASAPVREADLVVTMMWNTDRTDVDLHVIDSNGEECYYSHNQTKMGGRITGDVTDGYGPEMFYLPKAKEGRYQIKANYFGSDSLRSGMRSKVHITIYRKFGTADQTMTRKTISLGKSKEMRHVADVVIK